MMSRLFLAWNALAIGSIGLFYLYDPNLLLARYGLESGSTGMDNMLRATYGGLYLLSAGLFLVGVLRTDRRKDALGFLIVFMAGTALGRVVSLIAAGPPPSAIFPLLYYEVGAALIAVVLYMRVPRSA